MSRFDNAGAGRVLMPPHSLVVFVGMGAQPAVDRAELFDGLARDGVRGLWLDHPEQALAAAAHAHFDAAVVRLDDRITSVARSFDGWRRLLGCPLLVVAEIEDEVDEIIALELGADAVLPPPVSARRLRAHLMRLLRRTTSAPQSSNDGTGVAAEPRRHVPVQGWTLDRVHNRLLREDRAVSLSEMQAALLQVLMDDFGRVVPRLRLLAAVSLRHVLQPRSVDVYISRLRQRLQEQRVDDLVVEGVRGRGYRVGPGGGPSRPVQTSSPTLAWAHPLPLRPMEAVGG